MMMMMMMNGKHTHRWRR